jgi:alpha-galactosidase/6-phospho-beta-glucosidase family protein
MRYSVSIVAISAALIIFAADAVVAQTSAPMSKSALRQQDRDECAKQVTRYQGDEFLECVANREAARKAAEKKRAADERAARRAKATQDFEKAVKEHEELSKERLAQIEQERAKRVDCRKQASDQKLHFAKRLRFIEKCVEAK